jgi:hypothetical protein
MSESRSVDVRAELVDIVERDLLGPWDSLDEELPPSTPGPRERYLVGQLGPIQQGGIDALHADGSDVDLGQDSSDPTLREIFPSHVAGNLWLSSMGLSFMVAGDVHAISVLVEWGHYRKVESEQQLEDRRSRAVSVWKRHPIRQATTLYLDHPAVEPAHMDHPQVQLDMRSRRRDGHWVVHLSLVNKQETPGVRRDEAWLFQPRLVVTATDGVSAIFRPFTDPLDDNSGASWNIVDPEDQHLALLYRDVLEFAVGRGVAAKAAQRAGERAAWELATTWLPRYEVPQTVAPSVTDISQLAGLELGMGALAELESFELERALLPLADGYRTWLKDKRSTSGSLPDHLAGVATVAFAAAERIAERIRQGIDVLRTSPEALESFRFANRAMALQRLHTDIARHRLADPKLSYAAAHNELQAKAPQWRPFQLAFVLLNLPALTDPLHCDRIANSGEAVVDLLFFPTGGGKTEAYLGLAAYTFAIRRMQGMLGTGPEARDGGDGVGVLMRYTLRLLTAQQFQRAATLICACESLRRSAISQGDDRWGTEPFRIGLWVGSKVSPNSYTEARQQAVDARQAGTAHADALQILACPWCGEQLRADRDLYADDAHRRLLVYCGDPHGRCLFTERNADGEGIPVLTVDEEIYRFVPSLLIATVDKLAQLPWNGSAGMLFGRVSRRCARHGYRHRDLDSRVECRDNHRNPPGRTNPVDRLRPPDLIIQDELHLISGALGTTVGLFEAAVDQLCTWAIGDREIGPKIIASTATVKRAAHQVNQVFARDLAVFPTLVLDHADTFFSRQVEVSADTPGRMYLGVCAHGVRLKAAEIRLASILLVAGQYLLDTHGAAADPYLTLVGYFNATRELAGMRRCLDDDVITRTRRGSRRWGLANRAGGAGSMLRIQELTSRVPSRQIPTTLRLLDVEFDPANESTSAKRSANERWRQGSAVERKRLTEGRAEEPVDVVLATSMLQVGVDVSRLGLMVMTGQPKNTAEYIQATSRVGRDVERPGLVVTLYGWTRPRDLAHYEHFAYYHATLYKQVEALSVTPYARRALDRGFAATFVAAVRQLKEEYSGNRDAQDVPLGGELVQLVIERLVARERLVAGTDHVEQKAKELLELWSGRRGQDFRLGYKAARSPKENITGLLQRPSGEWTPLTVGESMRETEDEITLLLPRGSVVDAVNETEPPWRFGTGSGDDVLEDDIPVADELGDQQTRSEKS